jgi:hypothetical protein
LVLPKTVSSFHFDMIHPARVNLEYYNKFQYLLETGGTTDGEESVSQDWSEGHVSYDEEESEDHQSNTVMEQ